MLSSASLGIRSGGRMGRQAAWQVKAGSSGPAGDSQKAISSSIL